MSRIKCNRPNPYRKHITKKYRETNLARVKKTIATNKEKKKQKLINELGLPV